jgi:hypothetical protein
MPAQITLSQKAPGFYARDLVCALCNILASVEVRFDSHEAPSPLGTTVEPVCWACASAIRATNACCDICLRSPLLCEHWDEFGHPEWTEYVRQQWISKRLELTALGRAPAPNREYTIVQGLSARPPAWPRGQTPKLRPKARDMYPADSESGPRFTSSDLRLLMEWFADTTLPTEPFEMVPGKLIRNPGRLYQRMHDRLAEGRPYPRNLVEALRWLAAGFGTPAAQACARVYQLDRMAPHQ